MISFFPDLNVWLALSDAAHRHNAEAWRWHGMLPADARLVFCRYTQIGLLRLLTNSSVMAGQTLTLQKAWDVYERWRADPRIELYPEPHGMDQAFRHATGPFLSRPASKWVGDCYLLAYAKQLAATLVTFDGELLSLARKQGHPAIAPA